MIYVNSYEVLIFYLVDIYSSLQVRKKYDHHDSAKKNDIMICRFCTAMIFTLITASTTFLLEFQHEVST